MPLPSFGDRSLPPPRFKPKPPEERPQAATVRLPGRVWRAVDELVEETEGEMGRNEVLTELLTWAVEEYRKANPADAEREKRPKK